jgi:predicted HTH domain antitoxin
VLGFESMATIQVDDELLAALPGSQPGPAEQLRELVVLELYRRRVLSSGRAAELLEMGREEFIRYASRLGIPFLALDEVETGRELASSRDL